MFLTSTQITWLQHFPCLTLIAVKGKKNQVKNLFSYCSFLKICIASGCRTGVGYILHRAQNKRQGRGQKQLYNRAVMSALEWIRVSFYGLFSFYTLAFEWGAYLHKVFDFLSFSRFNEHTWNERPWFFCCPKQTLLWVLEWKTWHKDHLSYNKGPWDGEEAALKLQSHDH